jgi:N-acyl-D-amino-acid deacylase
MHDVVLRGGVVYDGEGGPPYAADVAIDADLISAVMPAIGDRGRREIDVSGLAVAPGFINVLSWAIPSLIADGRAQSDVRQGVTLEVFGEGSSMGPLTHAMRSDRAPGRHQVRHTVDHPPAGPRSPRSARRLRERRIVRRRDDLTRARGRL